MIENLKNDVNVHTVYVYECLCQSATCTSNIQIERRRRRKRRRKETFLFVMLFASSERTTKEIRRNQLLNIKQND